MIKRGVDVDSMSDGAGSSSGMPLLFTPGGNAYNEHIIHSAKALGQQLFVELPADERKAKLDSEVCACGVLSELHGRTLQIDKLQVEIDTATRARLEQAQIARDTSRALVEREYAQAEYDRLEDTVQSLAVLMLHYCAGLQHCLDQRDDTPPVDDVDYL
jgi:hypothetical protein